MPELPEVETIRLSLLPVLKGRTITQADILTPQVWLDNGLPATGWQIVDIGRRGKYLIFRLAGPVQPNGVQTASLIVHLRMTGQLLLQTADQPPVKHDHVRLRIDDRSGNDPLWLVFHDTRRFGRLWLIPDGATCRQVTFPAGLAHLGPEPLDPAFDAAGLAARLARRPRTNLKSALLDQTVIAGLGNIYVDEALFASGLHPLQAAGSLNQAAAVRLAAAISSVLRKSIDCQGTTLRDYVNGWNQKGTFQDCLMVYSRAGKPCRQCGTFISRGKVAGRGTCWCPTCQPEPTDANGEGAGR